MSSKIAKQEHLTQMSYKGWNYILASCTIDLPPYTVWVLQVNCTIITRSICKYCLLILFLVTFNWSYMQVLQGLEYIIVKG